MPYLLCKHIIMLTLLGCMAQSLQAATLTVTNVSDSGSGSLRETLANADDGDTLVFARSLKDLTIVLPDSSQISIDKNITLNGDVNGDKRPDITISGGGHSSRLFKIEKGVEVTLKSLNLIHGHANEGGGILNNGTLTMEYCRMSNNYANWTGGAIQNWGKLTISDGTFDNNASGSGGAIFNVKLTRPDGGDAYIQQSTFKSNVAREGGGGAISNFGKNLVISASTLAYNRADKEGSAVYARKGVTAIRSSTLYGNKSTSTGDLNHVGTVYGACYTCQTTVELVNTVVAGSTGRNCGADKYITFIIDHSWFDDDSCENGDASGAPELGPLGNNGGYTETMMPSGHSGLIDAGNSQTCTVRDQRLAPRVGTCDIGSVEGGSKAPVGPIPGDGDDTDAMSALVPATLELWRAAVRHRSDRYPATETIPTR